MRKADGSVNYLPTAMVETFHVKQSLEKSGSCEGIFKHGYTSVSRVLRREPSADNRVRNIPAQWKEIILNNNIIDIFHNQF